MRTSGHRILGSPPRHTRGFARRVRSGALVGAMAFLGAVMVGGCASYANVPEPVSPASTTSPNRRHPKAVMTASLLRVVRVYPTGTPRFAVALPAGVTQQTIDEVLLALGPGAELATGANAELPMYSIGRIWIRGGSAKVDVFRPVVELGRRDDGTFDRQAITAWLEGGIEPWRVIRTQRWEIGAFPRPYAEAHPGESAELNVPGAIENGSAQSGSALNDTALTEPDPVEVPEDGARNAVERAAEPSADTPRPAPEPADAGGVIRIESVGGGA